MKILVTGNAGMIGAAVEKVLHDDGYEIVGFDIKNGQDILNQQQIRNYIQGCDAVVHLAALLGNSEDSANDVMAVNLLGTWHILTAALEANVKRVVFFSSVDALGVFKGEGQEQYVARPVGNYLCATRKRSVLNSSLRQLHEGDACEQSCCIW